MSFPEILNLNSFVAGVRPAEGGDAARFDDAATTDSGAVLDDDAPAAADAAVVNGPAVPDVSSEWHCSG